MKCLFVCIVLCLGNCLGGIWEDEFEKSYYGRYQGGYDGNIDKNRNQEDITRPCALNDWQCMRMFLASVSKCQPSYGPIPDPLVVPLDKFFIPVVNMTITHINLEITGFRNARITEFYVNKATGNVVIAINVQNLTESAPKTYFSYQRTAKEAIILGDFTTVTYDSATFTAVIPKVPYLRLDLANIHADIHDGAPNYTLGPGLLNTDPDVAFAYLAFNSRIPSIIREAFLFQSRLLTNVYIQRYLCDFELNSYKDYLQFITTKGYTQVPNGVIDYDRDGEPMARVPMVAHDKTIRARH